MYKYYVKISFPDLNIPTTPETTAVFSIYARNSEKAVERACYWGVAIVKDIMKHNKINPFEIDLAAPALVKVVSCKLWREEEHNRYNGGEGYQF